MDELRRLFGIVKQRQTHLKRDGQPYVKAVLHSEEGESCLVLWWDAHRAPPEGARVWVQGKVNEYQGRQEIHVHRTNRWDDAMGCVAGFYRDCLEAEAAESLRLFHQDNDHILLEPGPGANPVVDHAVQLPRTENTLRWLQQRQRQSEETLMAGYLLVTGPDPEDPRAKFTSPLLFTEVQLREDAEGWWSEQLDGDIHVNPLFLQLLGVERENRDAYVRAIETSPTVEEARTPKDRVKAILNVTREVVDLETLQANNAIQHKAVIMVTSGASVFSRMLIEDLDELVNRPELLRNTPAAVLLGHAQAPAVPLPHARPAIVPSSLRQDEAVHAAMRNVFTVVTGPPGTGKSQVLVNVVAAAVAEGQKVLLASKNNKAVDVVVERLREVSPEGMIIRTGSTGRRNEVPDYIAQILAKPERPHAVAAAQAHWHSAASQVQEVFQVLHDRKSIQDAMGSDRQVLQDCLERLPTQISLSGAPNMLTAALDEARAALDDFGNRLGLFWRWRRHRKRLERAHVALDGLASLLDLDRGTIKQCLASVADRPTRSLAPRQEFRTVEAMATDWQTAQACTQRLQEAAVRLSQLPTKSALEDRLHALIPLRTSASQALLDARWNEVRWANRNARKAAKEYCDQLTKAVQRTGNAFQAAQLAPAAMPMLPVWAITNLSVRNNLPLQPNLFDLVVIDEASQCDIASALPLLARSTRALIIGDARQLIHITSLRKNRERRIAERWRLNEEQTARLSYASHSCYDLASIRVQASPIFLDLHFRSPAAIIGFADQRFYGGKMEWCNNARPPEGLRTIEWVNVKGGSERGSGGRSWINRDEARTVVHRAAQQLPTCLDQGLTVGIVTPFRAQAHLIQDLLSRHMAADACAHVVCATAHKFQGDERDLMYFSPVVSQGMPELSARFAADPNLVNVALTRAARQLVIVGNQEACLGWPGPLQDLADYVIQLESQGYDSPIELILSEALGKLGIRAVPGKVVGRHRLDLAIEQGKHKLDVECDGFAFHQDSSRDDIRDQNLAAAGWTVLRFSGRQIQRDPQQCARKVADQLSQ